VDGVNPHDEMEPKASVEAIVDHVEEGLRLARRYRLPSRVRAFIPEHHGTNWVSFFYKRAVEQAGGDESLVDPEDFTYGGPKPQSRETALVMLADGCEAAVRSIRPSSVEELREVIDRVIDRRVAEGQLDECDLTLHDLARTRLAFTSALKGLYHRRVRYPRPTR
jgi:hypothetical protein